MAKIYDDQWYDNVVRNLYSSHGSLKNILSSLGFDIVGAKESSNNSRIVIKCPYHNDKKPSFSVSESLLGHCFSCGSSANLVGLVAKSRGCSNKEAIDYLSSITGVARVTSQFNDRVTQNAAAYNTLFEYIKKFSFDAKLKSLVSKIPALNDEAVDFLKDLTASFSYDGVTELQKEEVLSYLKTVYPGSDLSSFDVLKYYFPKMANFGISFPNYGVDGKTLRGIVVMSNKSDGSVLYTYSTPHSFDRDTHSSFYNSENAFQNGVIDGSRNAILLSSPLTAFFLQELGMSQGIAPYDHVSEKHFDTLKRFDSLFLFEKDLHGDDINDYTAKYFLQSGVKPYVIKNMSEKDFCDSLFDLYLINGKQGVSQYVESLLRDKSRCDYILDYYIEKVTASLPPLGDGAWSIEKENASILLVEQHVEQFLEDFDDVYTKNAYRTYIGEKIKSHYCQEYAEINNLGVVDDNAIYGHMMNTFCNSINQAKVDFALKYVSRYIVERERELIPRYVSNALSKSRESTNSASFAPTPQKEYNDFLIGLFDVVCKEAHALLLMTSQLSKEKLEQMIVSENQLRQAIGKPSVIIQHPWEFVMSVERRDGGKGYSYAEVIDKKLGCFPFRTESQEKFVNKLCGMTIYGRTVTRDDLCAIGLLRKELKGNYTFLYPDFFIEPFEKKYSKKNLHDSDRGTVGFKCIKMSSASREEFTTYVIPITSSKPYSINESEYILRDLTGKIIPLKWSRIAGANEKGYEISFKGADKRFCANFAKLNDGRSIEEAYLLDVKGYRSMGYTVDDLYKKDDQGKYLIKYKPSIHKMSKKEEYQAYKALWEQFFHENPALLRSLYKNAKGCVLTDQYARIEDVTIEPIRAISEIINEKLVSNPEFFLPDVQRVLKVNKVFETIAADILHAPENNEDVVYWKNYVKNKRKISDPISEKYAIGALPDLREPEKYKQFLATMSRVVVDGKRITEEDLMMANIIMSNNFSYFQLSGRLIFPIHDTDGNTIGFSGRKSETDSSKSGKYVNSVASPWFSKTTVLYGSDYNKENIAKNKSAIIVEGYMDAIALDNTNTLAIMGTAAFSPERLDYLVQNGVQKVLICQDEDQGGRKSKIQSFEFLMNTNIEVWVSQLNSKNTFDVIKDIDELRKKMEQENPGLSPAVITQKLTTQLWDTAVPGFTFYLNEVARDVWLRKSDMGFEQPVVDRADYEFEEEIDEKAQQIRALLDFPGIGALGAQEQMIVFDHVRNKINSLSNPVSRHIYKDALDYYMGARSLTDEHPEFSTLKNPDPNRIIHNTITSDKTDDITI